MNTFTHKLGAALLLLCGLLVDVGGAAAGDVASSMVSSASSSAGIGSTASSMISSSAMTGSASNNAAGSAAASAPPLVTGNAGSRTGMNLGASPSNSGTGNVLQVIGALILVVAIMLGLAWGLKNFGPKRLLGRVPVQVVGGANLGGRERVLVIEVADQWIVIGATPNSITTLATLPRQSLNNEELQPGKPFSDWLKQIMEKRNG